MKTVRRESNFHRQIVRKIALKEPVFHQRFVLGSNCMIATANMIFATHTTHKMFVIEE